MRARFADGHPAWVSHGTLHYWAALFDDATTARLFADVAAEAGLRAARRRRAGERRGGLTYVFNYGDAPHTIDAVPPSAFVLGTAQVAARRGRVSKPFVATATGVTTRRSRTTTPRTGDTYDPSPLRTAARLATAAAVALASLGMTAPADAGTLTINIAFKGASQRAVWQSTLEAFHKAHPDIDVKATFVDEEAYKVQLPAWLTTVAPDVVNWHAGERMAYYAKRGLFEDLSGDWTKNGWGTMYASTRDASSYNGKQYAAPTVYYSWGCSTARTCSTRSASPTSRRRDQFLDACKRLKAAGITPIAVGGRDAWTSPAGSTISTCA